MLLLMVMSSEVKSSNNSLVEWSVSRFFMKLTSTSGTLCFCMLWSSWSVTAFGNVPSMSRKRMETTFPLHHASLTWWTSRWRALVVVWPGWPPKWVGGIIWWDSMRWLKSSVGLPKFSSKPMQRTRTGRTKLQFGCSSGSQFCWSPVSLDWTELQLCLGTTNLWLAHNKGFFSMKIFKSSWLCDWQLSGSNLKCNLHQCQASLNCPRVSDHGQCGDPAKNWTLYSISCKRIKE